MSKYLYLYTGPATMDGPPDPDVMAAWTTWMEKVGPALVDAGAPCGPGRASIKGDGSTGTTSDTTGYSIVSADSLDEAKNLLGGHPYLERADADFAIEVFELLEM